MARRREVHPDFFVDPKVLRLEPLERLFFVGLWCHADKLGVLIDDPDGLAVKILPREPAFDADLALSKMAQLGLVLRYVRPGFDRPLVWITHFTRYQRPHPREAVSGLPLPELSKPAKSEQGLPKADQGSPQASNSGRAFQAFQAVEPSRKRETDREKGAQARPREDSPNGHDATAPAELPTDAIATWLTAAATARAAWGGQGADPPPRAAGRAVLAQALEEHGAALLGEAHWLWVHQPGKLRCDKDGRPTRAFLTAATIAEWVPRVPPIPACAACQHVVDELAHGSYGPRNERLCCDCRDELPDNSWQPEVWEPWIRRATNGVTA